MSAAALTAFAMAVVAVLGQTALDVIVHTVDGAQQSAPLLEIGVNFDVQLGGKNPQKISGRDVIAVRRAGVRQPPRCPPPFIELTTGDCLPLALPFRLQLDDETLQVSLAPPLANAAFVVPQASVSLIALASAPELPAKRTHDSIVLKNGDTLAGRIAGLDAAKGARLVVAGQTQIMPLERVAQIAFNPEFQSRPRFKNTYADVILAGGSRLSLARLSTVGPDGKFAATTLLGQRCTFAANDLIALRMRQGNAIYLDELKPKSYESTPFLDVAWPLTTGRSLLGEALTIGDDTYPLGLGMHSRSKATYALDPADQWFEAIVAVDATAGAGATVRIDVELDGQAVPGVARTLKVHDAPASLRIQLKNAKLLTLVTDFGPRGDIQGHAIWADARIIRK